MYSQGIEEIIILNHFQGKKGTFLDIGANDGKTLSNVAALIDLGWSGAMIDPSPKAFEKLKNNYKENESVFCFNYAINNEAGIFDFYESNQHLSENDISLLSSLNKDEIHKWEQSQIFDKIQVECKAFNDFLIESPIKKFDFISIDAEGKDFEILQQINLSQINCKLLCIEWNSNYDIQYKIDIHIRTRNHAELIFKNNENLIYKIL